MLLEEFVATKLESALEEVASSGGAKASPDGASALVGDDFPEAANETAVVGDRVELYSGFDAEGTLAWRFAIAQGGGRDAAIGIHPRLYKVGKRTHRRV